jgi:hypothetical protein
MANLKYPVVHSAIGWHNWPAQFVGKRRLEAFVLAVQKPLDDLDTVLSDMQTKRGVTTSVGKQLDGVGEIVGQPRYVPGAFLLPFFGYKGQPAITGYNKARYRREGESNEDTTNVIGDAEYQRLINWKIIMNSAAGTTEDVISAMRALFPDALTVIVTNPAPRQTKVVVTTKNPVSPVFATDLESYVPKLAGHSVIAEVKQKT